MQEILIVTNYELIYTKSIVDFLKTIYKKTTNKYWLNYFADHQNSYLKDLRTSATLLQAVIANNNIIGHNEYSSNEKYIAKIIEIPADVKWHIGTNEMTNGEYICEDHRIWY